ncbi:MAG: arabinose-5-phosphate isomerase [Halanaerobiales bacterium]|nr:arabinose-5-phosphate isomerase [Halanaerobiales bacterium]
MEKILTLNNTVLKKAIAEARRVLELEARSVLNLRETIGEEFAGLVKLIIESEGRVVFIGVGKSGIIAKKLAATFSSTGTPAFFVHAAEAFHGDLGMVTENDVVIAVSNSGETEEVLQLIPSIRRIGATIVAMTGNLSSTLAQYADVCLFAGVEEEACPHGLAPTASTTATLALGDALAIALSTTKGFTAEDFAIYHPGGSLGRRLLTKVRDVLEIRKANPVVTQDTSVKEALFTMTDSKMGSTSIVDEEGRLTGIITDGDIRRLLEKSADFLEKPVKEVMTKNPITITAEKLATEALKLMEDKEINDLPVIKDGKPVGMLNFQDLLRAKVF